MVKFDAEHASTDGWAVLLDRDPLIGPALALQATLSRFENSVRSLMLTWMDHALADLMITQHRVRRHGRARRITIDVDPTGDPAHGQQTLLASLAREWGACVVRPALAYSDDDLPEFWHPRPERVTEYTRAVATAWLRTCSAKA